MSTVLAVLGVAGVLDTSATATTGSNRSWPSITLGYSIDHRPIVALKVGDATSKCSVMVVGSIAGDEPGGITVAARLASMAPLPRITLWLLPDLNPDGAAAATRDNARGVDLNRNFPFAWQRLANGGSRYNPGSSPLSEPESRALAAFVLQRRPTVAIWLHQPYGLVDDSEGPLSLEKVVARATGLPLVRLTRYPGSAIGWEDHVVPGSAFDTELPGGPLSPAAVNRYVGAIRQLARLTAATHSC